MKICVFTATTGMIPELVAVTEPFKTQYCKQHGYEFRTGKLDGTGDNETEKYGFKRLALIADLLKEDLYDWIWVCGCDVLITNRQIKLESLIDENFGMVIGTEPTGCGMDSFLIRKSHGGLELVERLYEYRSKPIGGAHEQSTLDALMKEDPSLLKVVKLLPQRMLNAYKYKSLSQYGFLSQGFVTGTDFLGNSGEWQPGDFVLHTPGLPYSEQKLNLFAEAMPFLK